MAPPPLWWSAAAILLLYLTAVLIAPSHAIYCDEDDCYDLLGLFPLHSVSQSANSSEIKKTKQSNFHFSSLLPSHPDKNPDPETRKQFVKIANAYEIPGLHANTWTLWTLLLQILKDEATREQYDYAIAHPEEVFYNTARYYHAYYGHKTVRDCCARFLISADSRSSSSLNRPSFGPFRIPIPKSVDQAVNMVKKTPAYKNRLRALELERRGALSSKKKGCKQMDKKMEEDLSKELDLEIKGAEKPSCWNLLAVKFLLLPYTIGKQTDHHLTVIANCVSDEAIKSDLVHRRLWVKANMESYQADMRKESKRRR
ncbi:hypothetical protein ACLOJK_039564 [Asimina triloba]